MSNIQAPYIPNTPFTYGYEGDEEDIIEAVKTLFGEDNDDETVSREIEPGGQVNDIIVKVK